MDREESSKDKSGAGSSDEMSVDIHDLAVPAHHEITRTREGLFLTLMCLSQLIVQASSAQTITIGNYIGKTFGVEGQSGEIAWFSAAFSLTAGTFILISGRLGDMFGYKRMYLIGYAWYTVWSLVAGFSSFAHNRVFFSVMRAIQGIGPALMMPNTQALIASYYPDSPKKFIFMSLFGAVAPSGFVLGALFSTMFAQLVWWPWTFWVAGICSSIAGVGAYFAIPKNVGHKSGGSFDWIGSATGVAGLILINFALNQGPVVGWDTPYVYVLFIVGFLFMAAFFYVERKVANPLVPSEVLKGDTGFVLGCIACGWACFGVWIYYTFQWSYNVDKDTPVKAAVISITVMPMGFIGAIASAILLQKIPSSIVMVFSMCAFLTGITLQATRPVGQIYWRQKFFSFITAPLGMDTSFPSACIILSQAFPKHRQGIAGSLVSTWVNYSISVGIGLASAVEIYTTKHKVPSFETTVHGYRNAFYLGMGLAGAGILLSVLFVIVQYSTKSKKEKAGDA